jgi:small subunit ribosomal protein S16
MALKIKLSRYGTRHTPAYRIVVAEERSRRDGAAVEQLGSYQPRVSDTPLKLNLERVDYWTSKGALPTNTVRGLIKRARKAAPAATPAPAAS